MNAATPLRRRAVRQQPLPWASARMGRPAWIRRHVSRSHRPWSACRAPSSLSRTPI